MAPTQPIQVLDPLSWHRSTVTDIALRELVNGGQLAPNVEGQPPTWIVLPAADREPNPPFGYAVSFIRHHERGFTAPASHFMRGQCHHYGVELHNFAPNVISQAATFVGVCEGFLGIPVNWDLWVHLFCAELHTLTTHEPRVCRAVRADGLSISLRDSRREFYIPCTMTFNNAEWERGWFYLRNDGAGLPLHRQGAEGEGRLLASRPIPLFALGSAGVNPARVEWHGGCRVGRGFGPRQPPPQADRPPMERELRIYEMSETANPVSLGVRGCCTTTSPRSMRPRGRGAPLASRPSGTAMTTSGHLLCFPTPRR
jgi:hypothetical protein